MSVGLAMVMAERIEALSAADIQAEITRNWPDLPPTSAFEGEGIVHFTMGDATMFFTPIDAPIPWADLEGPCATSMLWPDAEPAVKAHAAHWLVTVMGELEPIARSAMLTQATAILLSASAATIGVYWGNARSVIPKPIFLDFTREVLPHGPVVFLWVDFRVGQDGEGTSGFTTGMAELGHMEIEVVQAPEPTPALRERLINLTAYLLENGPVIGDGNTVGNDADERIQVRYAPSNYGRPGEVMRLEWAPSPKPKKKWPWSRD